MTADFDYRMVTALAFDLKKAPLAVRQLASMAVRKTAIDITADARMNAPVDTGKLKGSIGYGTASGGGLGSLAVEVGPTAEYGVFVELGTSRMAAQPYLGPAADKHLPAFEEAMRQLAERTLNG